MKRAILIILDGLGDRPCKEFFGETPLEAASTPFMNYLAREGLCGMMSPLSLGWTPESGPAHFEILGYHPYYNFYPGRGPLEALGTGEKIKEGDVVFRVNFATISKGVIIDRRAGRIKDVRCFEKDLRMEMDGIEFILKAGTEHRAALILRGENLSSQLTDSDPRKPNRKPKKVRSLSPEAKRTAKVLNKYIERVHKILENHRANRERKRKHLLPANFILLRGAGTYKKVEEFERRYGLKACCIAGTGLYKGVGRFLGMKILKVRGATGGKNTDLHAKFKTASKATKRFDFVFLHIKGTDLYGHDGDAVGKMNFIQNIDNAMRILSKTKALMVITGDHSTPCSIKDHSGDDVPILFYGTGDMRRDDTLAFGEKYCETFGALERIEGKDVIPEILNLTNRGKIIE